ncbi:MAG: hypothetical protein ACK5RE_15710 [Pseudanabaena sp.]
MSDLVAIVFIFLGEFVMFLSIKETRKILSLLQTDVTWKEFLRWRESRACLWRSPYKI